MTEDPDVKGVKTGWMDSRSFCFWSIPNQLEEKTAELIASPSEKLVSVRDSLCQLLVVAVVFSQGKLLCL